MKATKVLCPLQLFSELVMESKLHVSVEDPAQLVVSYQYEIISNPGTYNFKSIHASVENMVWPCETTQLVHTIVY